MVKAEYYTPNDAGCIGEDDSASIQNAITKAKKSGVNKVVIPRYNKRTDSFEWVIPVSIKLPSDITVVLDNCYMKQADGVFDHMFTNEAAYSEEGKTLAGEQHDIRLIGVGRPVLSGGKHNGLLEKTSRKYGFPIIWKNAMIYLHNVRDLVLENLHIEYQRWWAICFLFCRYARVSNIDFYALPHVTNEDGIDLRIGCNNFIIENITGRTGDDTIALTALIAKSYEKEYSVSGKNSDIHDVIIKNVKSDPYRCYNVRLLNHDGCKIYNVTMDNIVDASRFESKERIGAAICIGSMIYFHDRPVEHGETTGIAINNVYSRKRNAIILNKTLTNSTIQNVHVFGEGFNGISTDGGGCELENVLINGVFYNNEQLEICHSTPLEKSEYVGTAVNLDNMTGKNVKIKNVFAGRVRTAVRVKGGLAADIEGLNVGDATRLIDKDAASRVTLDGEEVK